MRVLVTGGGGYIGAVLVRRLLQHGHAVRVLDRLFWGSAPLQEVRDQIEVVHADIREPEDVWMAGIEGVIHLAGLSNDPTADFDPEANWQMNALATRDLAHLARQHGVQRFVFGSSCSLYDGLPDGSIYDEEAPIKPRGPYAESKRYAEEALLQMSGADFSPVILRQGTVYGHSPRMRFDLVVNTFVRDALVRGRFLLHGGGWMHRPLVDVVDAADAQIACLEAPEARVAGQIFNVVQDNYQIRQLAELAAEAVAQLGRKVEIANAPEPPLVRNYSCANQKLFETIGFKPARTVQDSVIDMVKIYGQLDAAAFGNPRYYNLEWMVLLNEMHSSLRPFDYVLRRGEPVLRSE